MAIDAPAPTRFELTLAEGGSLGMFSELVGITSSLEIQEFRDGTDTRTRLLPGARDPSTVTLRRALNPSIEFAAWHELLDLGDGAAAPKSCTLSMFAATGDLVARYHLRNAWPQRLEVAPHPDGSASLVTETVTLVCDVLQRVSV